MHACIYYFLLDVRANQCGCAWVPWSIDSFEKYSNFVYFTCIISSHLRMYLLFSFGCSGEPVRLRVSSLKYRFLWKIEYLRVLYMHNIISSTHVSAIFFWMFGRTSPAFVSSLKYRFLWKIEYLHILYIRNIISGTHVSAIFFWMFGRTSVAVREFPEVFEKYSNFVYFTCIISSHLRMYLLFSFGCSGEPVRPFVSSLKYRFLWKIEYLPILYIRNIISCTHVSTIFFWMFGRTSVAVREFPEV